MNEPGTILHAEDDDNDALFFGMALARSGVRNPVVRVGNGEEALQYLRGAGVYAERSKYPFPCLLVTDLKMPVLSGFELLAALKSVKEAAEMPVVVLSASVAESDKVRSLQLGARCCYSKPPHLEGLMALAAEIKQSWLVVCPWPAAPQIDIRARSSRPA